MPLFEANLLTAGGVHKKTVDAPDESSAREHLTAEEGVVAVLAIRKKGSLISRTRTPKFPLSLFLQELSTLLDAGLSLIESIEALGEKAGGRGQRSVFEQLVAKMREGQPFSQALATQPTIFPPLLIATVQASEGSGQLPTALRRFQHYELRLEQVRKRVTGALVYPVVVLTLGAGILFFMLFFVVPRFSAVFESMPTLPATAQVMLWWSEVVKAHGTLLISAVVATVVAAFAAVRTQRAKRMFANLLWRTPKLKDACHLFALSRFYRTAGLLLMGGTPAIEAFELSGRVLTSRYAERLGYAIANLREGLPVASVMTEHGLTTPVAERLLRVGEHSGELGGMCEKIAHFHDGALDRAIEMFSKLFEPILMLGVGTMVGAIVMLLYMPIFELASSIS